MTSYYDIDAILAEEELIPCINNFDFHHLPHLDPDNKKQYLPDESAIKMPLWAVKKWSSLGMVKISIPRIFGRKARERLEADPGDADLRKRNQHYFMSGRMVVDLIENYAKSTAANSESTPGRRNQRRTTAAVQKLELEAAELRRTLLMTYTGERLRKTLDWSMSSVGDDVTAYTKRLTEMELKLFVAGASATAAHLEWKTFGSRKVHVCDENARNSKQSRAVTPSVEERQEQDVKKRRTE